jgi:DNA repair protein RadC
MAAGMILVHNHPSGNLTPSAQDDSITQRIKKAAELLDMRVLDHIIVSTEGYYSYNDNSRL